MFSNTTIIGRLTKDPEAQYTASGIMYAKFSVAVDRDFKDKETGEKETEFFDCVAWRSAAEFTSQYVEKGRLVVCSGRMQSRKHTGDDGVTRTYWQLNVEKVSALDRPKNENGDQKRETAKPQTSSQGSEAKPQKKQQPKQGPPPPADQEEGPDPFDSE